jgi:hypothetical protein
MMNKKRNIMAKDQRLRRIHYELRYLFRLIWLDRLDEFYKQHRKTESVKEMQKISQKYHKTGRAANKYPIGSILCSDRDVDLNYNPNDSSLYYEPSYAFQQEEYRKIGNYYLFS